MEYVCHPSNSMEITGDGLYVDDLPATFERYKDGSVGLASFWKPSHDEIALLLANGVVKLTILGVLMPPVSIKVCDA